MTITIIIFFFAIIAAFGMLLFRAWEIRTDRLIPEEETEIFTPKLSFRYIEKIILYSAKHIVQWIVLSTVKLWFIIATKTKILLQNKLPKIHNLFKKKENSGTDSRKVSFVERAVMESKIKIKKVKEKIRQEHEDKIETQTAEETEN